MACVISKSVGIDTIQTRVRCLTDWLLHELVEMRHSNGRPMVRIYGPLTTKMRGPIVTMNFYDPAGHLLDYRRVEELAGEQRISLRTGCFCNPGAGETAEGITAEDVNAALAIREDLTLARFLEIVTARGGKSAGAIRVSFGLASNFADAERFVQFAKSLSRSVAPRDRRGDVRHRVLSHHARRKLICDISICTSKNVHDVGRCSHVNSAYLEPD